MMSKINTKEKETKMGDSFEPLIDWTFEKIAAGIDRQYDERNKNSFSNWGSFSLNLQIFLLREDLDKTFFMQEIANALKTGNMSYNHKKYPGALMANIRGVHILWSEDCFQKYVHDKQINFITALDTDLSWVTAQEYLQAHWESCAEDFIINHLSKAEIADDQLKDTQP